MGNVCTACRKDTVQRDEDGDIITTRGGKFEDSTFQVPQCLGSQIDGSEIKWLRPHEIVDSPKMFVGGTDQDDIVQGALGNCWLLSAMAVLAMNRELISQVVPDQDISSSSSGKVTIKFFNAGKWEKVEIDDRLPTKNGQLIYVHSAENNEFWPPLLEKAYAKLNGTYSDLIGGHTSQAMVDMTGGIAEDFVLELFLSLLPDLLFGLVEFFS